MNVVHSTKEAFVLNFNHLQRWFFSGNIYCFTGWHIPLSLLAIAALVVAALLIPLVSLISRRQHLIKVTIIVIVLYIPVIPPMYTVLYYNISLGINYNRISPPPQGVPGKI